MIRSGRDLSADAEGAGVAGTIPDAMVVPDIGTDAPDPVTGSAVTPVLELDFVALPYAFARKFGVTLSGEAVALREGADPKALIEVRRVLGRPFDVVVLEPAAFDRLLGDNYAMDGQATALAAVGMGDELDLLADAPGVSGGMRIMHVVVLRERR